MDETPSTPSVTPPAPEQRPGGGEDFRPAPRARKGRNWPQVLGVVVGLVGVAAIATSAWVYGETRRELVALATDIARLRLSLDLYTQREPQAAPDNSQALQDLQNRLSVLEENWRTAPAALPPITPPATPSASTTPQSGDCLPTGTRFMVSAGDTWPICNTGAVLSVGAVDNGFITLTDGTVIAQGGTIGLPGSQCMIGVLPGEGLSGYAEVRVTC